MIFLKPLTGKNASQSGLETVRLFRCDLSFPAEEPLGLAAGLGTSLKGSMLLHQTGWQLFPQDRVRRLRCLQSQQGDQELLLSTGGSVSPV